MKRLQLGLELFEQLKNVESASAAHRGVESLSDDELRAIVLFCVFSFRQEADDLDTYGAWSSR
jgi:hypothetical protein